MSLNCFAKSAESGEKKNYIFPHKNIKKLLAEFSHKLFV